MTASDRTMHTSRCVNCSKPAETYRVETYGGDESWCAACIAERDQAAPASKFCKYCARPEEDCECMLPCETCGSVEHCKCAFCPDCKNEINDCDCVFCEGCGQEEMNCWCDDTEEINDDCV